ncbi:hypothetical protein ACIPWF_09090 [Paenarthrobacter sp. NPDC089989]|uniref:hypothetical protein n=1 Tax=unclassified Paenarthrobacter TaxID=2634190 RepID=UPI00382FF1D4
MAQSDAFWMRSLKASVSFLIQFVGFLLLWLLFGGNPATAAVSAAILAGFLTLHPWIDGLLTRRRFTKWRHRGRLECWIRHGESSRIGLWRGWERGFVSFRPPSVDFVRNSSFRPPDSWLISFLVSEVQVGSVAGSPPLPDVRYLGPYVRCVRLKTTLGTIELAGFPEALEVLEAELLAASSLVEGTAGLPGAA